VVEEGMHGRGKVGAIYMIMTMYGKGIYDTF
jgi:hypothetical protein